MTNELLPNFSENPLRLNEAKTTMEHYFLSMGWRSRRCEHCGSEFLAKSEVNNCRDYKCSGNEFLERPSRRTHISADVIGKRINAFFQKAGYRKTGPIPVVNDLGSTLFAGTAAQIFDSAIFREEEAYPQDLYYIAQPVIRLQGESNVGAIGGFSTSFVNLATEQMGAGLDNHIGHIEKWLDVLSSLGIFVKDLTLKVKVDKNDWGRVTPEALTIKINYMGLELGVANYFTGIEQKTRNSLVISDLSFGLERITWAVNKTVSYYDVIGPLNASALGKDIEMDCYRTMVLMVGFGVKPSNKDRGSKVRMLAKKISSPTKNIQENLIRYYHRWWEGFISLPISRDETADIIVGELHRNINLDIRLKVGGSESLPINLETNEFVDSLIRSGVRIEKIRRAIKGEKI